MKSNIYFFVLCVLLYSVFATLVAFVFSFGVSGPAAIEWVWPALLLLISIPIALRERSVFSPRPGFLRGNFDVIAVFLASLAVRFYHINDVSIWFDEDVQAASALLNFPVTAGAIQHHPPGDMIFTKLGMLISGMQTWGLRFHSALFSSLAAALLYSFVKKLSSSILFSVLATTFFCFHHFIYRYGFEARPISLGVCLEILFLYVLYLSLREEKALGTKSPLWIIAAATFLYLSSLGMQPVFIVAGALICLALEAAFLRRSLRTFLGVFFGALFFAPLQLNVLLSAPARFTKTSGFNLNLFLQQLNLEIFNSISTFANPFLYYCIFFNALALLAFLSKKRVPNSIVIVFWFLLGFFCLTFIPLFKSHVDWPLYSHYLISVLPLTFLIFAAYWGWFVSFPKVPRIARLLLLALLFGAAKQSYHFPDGDIQSAREDMASAYKLVKARSSEKDILLTLCVVSAPAFCPAGGVGRAFYFRGAGPIAEDFSPSIEIYQRILNSEKSVDSIFFIYYSSWSNYVFTSVVPLGYLHKLSVFKLQVKPGALAESLIGFLEPLVKEGVAQNKLYVQPLEYLVLSYDKIKNIEQKNYYLNLYKDFPEPKTYSDYLNRQLAIAN